MSPGVSGLVEILSPKTSDYVRVGGGLVHRLAVLHGNVEIGEGCRVDAFSILSGNVKLGRFVHISTHSFLTGDVEFQDFSSCSPGVKVFSSTENLDLGLTNPCVPAKFRQVRKRPVTVGKHATIGTNSVVLLCDVPEGSVIGALSLAKGPMEPWWIYAGTPAKPVRARSRSAKEFEF